MLRYQITRRGRGFEDRHPLRKGQALRKLRSRLKHVDPPYVIEGDAEGIRYNLDGVMNFLRNHIDNLKAHERLVIEGGSYDQPKWVLRAIEVEPATGRLINWGQQWIGKSPYVFGASGPPGGSDCSGFTSTDALAVYNINLDHGAELQRQDTQHLRIFHDASDLQKDDFIFFNYGRLPWPQADHVEFVDQPGKRNLGSRPSTHGVSWYIMQTFDRDNIVAFGRLRHD